MSDEVLGRVADAPELFLFWCPGCECAHHLETRKWKWNGDLVKPTATPSLRIRGDKQTGGGHHCHLWVKDGQLKFLNDCTHDLGGQTVAMVPWDQAGDG